MDSILTNIVNAPQMSAIDFVNFADGSTWAAATYKRVVFIPANARVSGFGIMVGVAAGSSTGTNTITIGHDAGTLQADVGMTNAAATADVDAYAKAVNLQTAGFTGPERGPVDAGVTAGVELMCKPPTMTSSAQYTYAPSLTAPWSASGEKVIPVVGYITTGATQSTGTCHWWVNYVFDANIVWEQSSL
jgi:hypothetical protein